MFPEMRMKKRQVSQEEAKLFLEKGEYGFFTSVREDGYPYSVPVNYIYFEDAIYFHCGRKGHKVTNIENNDKVCFSVVTYADLDPDDMSTDYESVIAFGKSSIVPESERTKIYEEIVKRFAPNFKGPKEYIEKFAPAAYIVKIKIESITGKARYDKRLRK